MLEPSMKELQKKNRVSAWISHADGEFFTKHGNADNCLLAMVGVFFRQLEEAGEKSGEKLTPDFLSKFNGKATPEDLNQIFAKIEEVVNR